MSKTLAQKLLEVQKKIGAVSKSSINPHFRSKYASLDEVLDVSKSCLNDEGVFIAQGPGKDAFGQYVETSLIDAESGQQIQGKVYFSGAEDNMQKIGAAITYARRFGLTSLLALETEDDDGESAVGRGKSNEASSRSESSGIHIRTNKMDDKGGAAKNISPQKEPSREEINKKISLTSKVLIDSKRMSQDEVYAMLTAYAVKTKEELSDAQATKLLSQLKEKLDAK